jgi:hypothetical protein
LEDLNKYFSEALSHAKYRDVSTNPLLQSSEGEQNKESGGGFDRSHTMDSVDSGIAHMKSNRDIHSFLQGKELSKRLIRVRKITFIRSFQIIHCSGV